MKRVFSRLNIAIIVICMFFQSASSVSFAKTAPTSDEHFADKIANYVTVATGEKNIVDDFEESVNTYTMDTYSITYDIPKDSNQSIITTTGSTEEIGLSLPKELSLKNGMKAKDGSIVYAGSGSASLCTQVLVKHTDGEIYYSNRNSIIIENSKAPHKYTFTFDLPKGYKLCAAADYNKQRLEYYKSKEAGLSGSEYNNMLSRYDVDSKEVYIIDEENEIAEVIEAAWAKDSSGNDVETSYVINNNSLIQTVIFDEHNSFPIVADPTAHPTKYKYFSLKKGSVKTLRDKYSTSARSAVVGYISSVALTKFSILSIGLASVSFASNLYAVENHKLWTKVYDGFKGNKNMVKIRVAYNWNDLHKAYAPSRNVKIVSYYKK